MGILDRFTQRGRAKLLFDGTLDIWMRSKGVPAPIDGVLVVMVEIGWGDARVRVFAGSDGSASVYYSTGGGDIGGEGIPAVAEAAKELVRQAARDTGALAPTREIPTVADGMVVFCVRTMDGLRSATVSERALMEGGERLEALFDHAHGVITEFRVKDAPPMPFTAFVLPDGGLFVKDVTLDGPVFSALPRALRKANAARLRGSSLEIWVAPDGDATQRAAVARLRELGEWQDGAPPDGPLPEGSSLHAAIGARDVEAVADLLARGADSSLVDAHGYTPLMLAAQQENEPIARALLAAGADPHARGPRGKTALDIAREYYGSPVIAVLEAATRS